MSPDDYFATYIGAERAAEFREAWDAVIAVVIATAAQLDELRRRCGYETPRASAMHAAYRAKTRRRNRR